MSSARDAVSTTSPQSEALGPYLDRLEEAAAGGTYSSLADAAAPQAGELRRRLGRAGLADFHRRVLACQVDRLASRLEASALPPSLAPCFERHRLRMRRLIEDADGAYFDLGNDRYLKDLAICLLRLYPVGAELLDPRSGLPKSLLLRGGSAQLLRGVRLLVRSGFALRPYCELHMHPDSLEEFNERGWIQTYLRIADVLESDSRLLGLFGTAWFYDPALAEISPHLAYLREYRIRHGAEGFDYGPSAESRDAALSRSMRRRRLHAEGRYIPRSYYLVWSRAELTAWARDMRTRGVAERAQ